MGRLTKRYSPVPFDLTVRVRPVCSPTIVTSALGMTLPELSVTSPVMPPNVCCASREEVHSATTATKASSRNIEEEMLRMENNNARPHKVKISRGSCWGVQDLKVGTPVRCWRQTKKRKR